MKKIIFLLIGIICLVASCTSNSEEYNKPYPVCNHEPVNERFFSVIEITAYGERHQYLMFERSGTFNHLPNCKYCKLKNF